MFVWKKAKGQPTGFTSYRRLFWNKNILNIPEFSIEKCPIAAQNWIIIFSEYVQIQ